MAYKVIETNYKDSTSQEYMRYFVQTLATLVYMDENKTKTIKQYVDETVNALKELLIDGAPETMDSFKEIAELLADSDDALEALNTAILTKANKSEVLYTNTTPTVSAHGGIAAGSTFDEVPITDMLTKILYPWVAPVVTAKVAAPSNGGTFEKGNTQTVTSIQVTVTKKSAKITKVEIFDGSTSLGSKTGTELDTLNNSGSATLTFTVNRAVSTNKSFQAKVTDADNKVTTANTGAFTFVYPYYQGVVAADATINEATVKGLTKIIQSKGTKAVTYNATNQRMVFATVASNGVIRTITDPNGFNVTDTFTRTSLQITGLDGTAQSYYVYTSAPTTVSNFKETFAH